MGYKSDIEIAQSTPMNDIREIAKDAGISEDRIELYGNYKAKVDYNILTEMADKPDENSSRYRNYPDHGRRRQNHDHVGLADGLRLINKKVMVALAEPSLGPVFGVKGGAGRRRICTGRSDGGY